MAKHLNTIFPVVSNFTPLFGKSKLELRKELLEAGAAQITVPESFVLDASQEVSADLELDNSKIDNYVPGAVEIPLQTLIDAGFTIKAYLKNDTKDCLDDTKDSGIIIFNVQHKDPDASYMVDGFSANFDAITEIEITSLNTLILEEEKPGLFGKKFDKNEAMKYASIRIRDILLERAEAKRVMLARLEEYNKNPEKRAKDTKKHFENLKFKYNQMKKQTTKDKVEEFNKGALKILGGIAGINNLKSFDELKNIDIFKKEIDAGGSFGELLNKFCAMADKVGAIPVNEETTENTETTENN